jgi:alpha-L-arabinofuranosidase
VVPLLQNNMPLTGQDSLYASATVDKKTNELIIKLVNASGNTQARNINIEGVKTVEKNAMMTVLESAQLDDVNSLNDPNKIIPKETSLTLSGKKIPLQLRPYSFTVVRVKMS